MLKKLFLPFAMLAALLLLTGCYKIDGEVTISDDETISGVIYLGLPDDTPQDQQVAYFRSFGIGNIPQIKVEPWAEDKWIGRKLTITNLPFEAFNKINSDVQITKDGDIYQLVGSGFAESNLPEREGFGGAELPTIDPEWKMEFTFPVPVSDSSPEVDVSGNTATVDTAITETGGTFTIEAGGEVKPKSEEGPVFGDPPPAAGTQAWPIPPHNRNQIPVYVFSAMIFLGIAAVLYGRFGNVSSASKKNPNKTSLGSKKAKPSKKKKKK